MDKKRNGLLEIYRFMLCFWPLYYHRFCFFEKKDGVFSVAELTVDFFFILSGYFLMRLMQREKNEPMFKSTFKMMLGRIKPMAFTMIFIAAFNFVCVLLFIRSDYLHVIFELFKYWWYVWYLTLGIGIFYIAYRLIKNEKLFILFLAAVSITMAVLQYMTVIEKLLPWQLAFVFRPLGCIPVGLMLSYIPMMKSGKFNVSIPIVAVLLPTLLYMAYADKTYFTCLLMIGMFAALVYFSVHIPIGGPVFDFLGKLSVRMYLYMAFVTRIHYLGLTHHRVLFVIDVALAVMDVLLTTYRQKYKKLKASIDK